MCRRELLELAIDHPVVMGHSSLIRGVVVLEAETGRRRDKDMNRLARGQASELWNVVRLAELRRVRTALAKAGDTAEQSIRRSGIPPSQQHDQKFAKAPRTGRWHSHLWSANVGLALSP